MILSAEVLALLFLNMLFAIFGTIAFWIALTIYLKWDFSATTQTQYSLERSSYLGATIIKYILIFKLLLFIYFIFTLDKISNVITGAMCAAGVVDATEIGIFVLLLKLLNIYLFGFWLLMHYRDELSAKREWTQLKFGYYTVIYLFLMAEIVLETKMFMDIDVDKMVSCCGVLYSQSAATYISTLFRIDSKVLVTLFYGLFIALSYAYIVQKRRVYSLLMILFLPVALLSLILFFGTYIYELPTHHCPFCFLQKDYNHVGYLIYILLFIATFYGVSAPWSKNIKLSYVAFCAYTAIVSWYVMSYYIVNGVWL